MVALAGTHCDGHSIFRVLDGRVAKPSSSITQIKSPIGFDFKGGSLHGLLFCPHSWSCQYSRREG